MTNTFFGENLNLFLVEQQLLENGTSFCLAQGKSWCVKNTEIYYQVRDETVEKFRELYELCH